MDVQPPQQYVRASLDLKDLELLGLLCTWAPKVCKIMAFKAVIMALGLFFYTLLGFRYGLYYRVLKLKVFGSRIGFRVWA